MTKALLERLRQGHHTMRYPAGAPPELPKRYRGLPILDDSKCSTECQSCVDACPTDAINRNGHTKIDLGRCLFCVECQTACPHDSIEFTRDYRLSTRTRSALETSNRELQLAEALDSKLRRIFGRSLKLRQVSAGGCGACEADVNVLGTIGWDLGRFGIQLVASPRHADGILVTGCVTENMKIALEETYAAVPSPKIVIAVGACAISGGPFLHNPQQLGGASSVVPVDLFVPGCPPHPLTILDGLLRLLGRLDEKQQPKAEKHS